MTPTSVAEFAQWVGGAPTGFSESAFVTTFSLDSSQVHAGDLFLAIKGARVDGHDFVSAAMASGAIGSLVERPVDGPHILVPNLVEALAKLGSHFRDSFAGPVVGITGSAGKTTTKEFVAASLSPLGQVLKTPGNRNSEFTAPLVWAELQQEHKAVVIEMAMRGFDQIAHLASFSRPQVGVITNIGFAHMEMVGSRHGIAQAKGELLEALPNEGAAILWNEDELLAWLTPLSNAQVWTFGVEPSADCQITDYEVLSWNSARVSGMCDAKQWEAIVPAAGRHIALNAAAAVLTAAVLGLDPRLAAAEIQSVKLPPMRMEVVEWNGATILLDTYNASPPSMIAAIETLADLHVEGRRFAVIGEMRELGEYSEAAHRSVGAKIGSSKLDHVLFYGPATEASIDAAIESGLRPDAVAIATCIEDVQQFLGEMRPGDAGMIKGSRALELERGLPKP